MQVKYVCDFCGTISENKEEMVEHEKECVENPEAKCCETCDSLKEDFSGDRHFYSCKKGKYTPTRRIKITSPCEEWKNDIY